MLRLLYHNETPISRQESNPDPPPQEATGRARQRARTREAVLDAARRLMREGAMPSVADAAEAANVSRATGYRYFPTQAALIMAAVGELLAESPTDFAEQDPVARVAAMSRRVAALTAREEPLLRAALRLSLEQWARRHAGEELDEEPIVRGGRRAAIAGALDPVADQLQDDDRARLEAALALVNGIEAHVILADIFGLDTNQAQAVMEWASTTLAHAAFERTTTH